MINGLVYLPNIIDTNQAHRLIQHIDNEAWRTDLKRRVQHYGYVYDYKRRTVDHDMYLGALPDWSMGITNLLALYPDFGIEY